MSVYELIREAILTKRQVVATYNGDRREMCPHVLGRNKHGREQALFYQFAGGSTSPLGPPGSRNNWRCIPIAGLTGVELRGGGWFSAPNHSRPQSCVESIDVEVEF